MSKAIILGMFLLLGGTVLSGGVSSAQRNDNFESFWKRFRTAVIRGDSTAVANLSKFPVRMSEPAEGIKDRFAMRRRFHELFSVQVDAQQCFAHTEPTPDTENPEIFTLACRYDRGSDAAAYQFEHTESGWRFTHFQLSTTCRCR